MILKLIFIKNYKNIKDSKIENQYSNTQTKGNFQMTKQPPTQATNQSRASSATLTFLSAALNFALICLVMPFVQQNAKPQNTKLEQNQILKQQIQTTKRQQFKLEFSITARAKTVFETKSNNPSQLYACTTNAHPILGRNT